MSFLDKHQDATDVLPSKVHDFDAEPIAVMNAATVRVSLDIYEDLPKNSGKYRRKPEITGAGADGMVRIVAGGQLTWALCKMSSVPRRTLENPDGEIYGPDGVAIDLESKWCEDVGRGLHVGEEGALVVEYVGLGEKREAGMNQARIFRVAFVPGDWTAIAKEADAYNRKVAKAAQKGD